MKTHSRTVRPRIAGALNTFGDFVCINCRHFVSADVVFSNVRNRNHCPYCLRSRHLDLYEAGDRLSACKGCMHPLALTLKRSTKKYARANSGELMLVHGCDECGKLSINRIAADDSNTAVLEIFEASARLDDQTRTLLVQSGITMLNADDRPFVSKQLWGQSE